MAANLLIGEGQLRDLQELGFIEPVLLEPVNEELVEEVPLVYYLLFFR